MADTAAPAAAPATPKKGRVAGSKKPKAKASHPPTSSMVNKAIKDLKERGGSSLQAIKKYISATYKIDAEKLAPFIRKHLKKAVASGELVQTKGKGASGSFKLASAVKDEKAAAVPKKAKKPAAPKAKKAAPKSPKKVAAKKPAKPKKSPSKVKKSAKTPTKPKAPKPKKAAKKSPKKAAPKKK